MPLLMSSLFEFTAGDQTVRLTRPVPLRIAFEEGMWFAENESLSLFGHGQSVDEAVADFVHDLGYLWARYRALTDEELSENANNLKKLLVSLTE